MAERSSLWSERLTTRQARAVARTIRAAGYGSATIPKCSGTIIDVARYFEPGNPNAREVLLDTICRAAGLKP